MTSGTTNCDTVLENLRSKESTFVFLFGCWGTVCYSFSLSKLWFFWLFFLPFCILVAFVCVCVVCCVSVWLFIWIYWFIWKLELPDPQTKSANCITAGEEHIYIGCAEGLVRVFSSITLHFISTLPHPHHLGVDVATATSSRYIQRIRHKHSKIHHPDITIM